MMIPIIVCICVATILHSLHKCTIWKSWLTYYGALLRHPFRGTCCGLYSWEIAISSRTVRFTMNHRHFWAPPRQWLSKAKGIESDYSCSIRQLGSEIPCQPGWNSQNCTFLHNPSFPPCNPCHPHRYQICELSLKCFISRRHCFLQSVPCFHSPHLVSCLLHLENLKRDN